MAYTKLFNSIVTSTIWTEDDKTRIVWITMLAIADKNGEVQGSIPGLARIAAVPVEDCRTAISKFLSPDPDSRTKDDEGRRIEEIDGGWALLNHQKYREMASKEESRESEAKRKARYRARVARNEKNNLSHNVPDMSHDVPESWHIAQADAYTDTDAKADKKNRIKPAFQKPTAEMVAEYGKTTTPPFTAVHDFMDYYDGNGWKIGTTAMKDWKATVRRWSRNQKGKGAYGKPEAPKFKGMPEHDLEIPDA